MISSGKMVISDFTDLLQFRHPQTCLKSAIYCNYTGKKGYNFPFLRSYSPKNNTGLKKTKKILTSLLEFIII